MALQGAEILFYPTAIGSEPQDGNLDSREHWKRVMQGHAGANLVLIVVLHSSNTVSASLWNHKDVSFHTIHLRNIGQTVCSLTMSWSTLHYAGSSCCF